MQPSQNKLTLSLATLPDRKYAFTGIVYLNPNDFEFLRQRSPIATKPGVANILVDIKGFVFSAEPLQAIEKGSAGLNSFQRDKMLQIGSIETFDVYPANVKDLSPLLQLELNIEIKIVTRNDKQVFKDGALFLEEDVIATHINHLYKNRFCNKNESFATMIMDNTVVLICNVSSITPMNVKSRSTYGIINNDTDIICKSLKPQQLKIESMRVEEKEVFNKNINFQDLGIGGLDAEFNEIFRRAFNSRRYPSSVIEKYGIKHVKGMLLYGPPGTGKTLIAGTIAKALNCKEPKIVNGPEIFDKYVGEGERKIRELFADAEKDWAEGKEDLHVIIFDEIDAVCKKRSSGGGAGSDASASIVNQLLTKLDGVDSGDNILVIGMTNRKELLDEAIVRAGRLEIHLEIGLPNEHGRKQIFQVHTKNARENGLLASDVDLAQLAKLSKNYCGAEIAGVCRSACSVVLYKDIQEDPASAASMKSTPTSDKKSQKKQLRQISMADFMYALNEVRPRFGMDETSIENSLAGGFFNYSSSFDNAYNKCQELVSEIQHSSTTQLLTLLIDGEQGSGKTAVASKLALESGFPFVKFITPKDFVGMPEFMKISNIVSIFEDAYKSDLSLIVLDDLERLIEYITLGPRFSNAILQTLLVLIRKPPNKLGRKLIIIGTMSSSMRPWLKDTQLIDAFNVNYHLPSIRTSDEVQQLLGNFKCSAEVATQIGDELEKIYGDEGESGLTVKDMVLAIDMSIHKSDSNQIEFKQFIDAISVIKSNI